ncbi:MAG: hypothetical protein IPJ28_02335 [Betaproteobacteria bacterium]|nr:hypothetical protein [Betaproteobacteria bacterium]
MARKNSQAPAWTRQGVKRRLVERLWVRFHMSLILASSGLSAMLASWALLQVGVGSMLVRYPIAIAVAYGTFLLGVWIWLQYAGVGDGEERKESGNSLVDGADLLDIPIGGGKGGGGSGGGFAGKGGGFDGGGASGSWVEGGPRGALSSSSPQLNARAFASSAGSDAPSSGSGTGFDLDLGDDLGMVILGLLLVLAVLASSGYLVWAAPDILTEAAFGAMLAGGLARRSKHEDAAGWVAGVIKKTWWPFAIVLVLAIGFAGYAAKHHPQAKTFKQALEAASVPDMPK